MRLSTFSFNDKMIERVIPQRPWEKIFPVCAVLAMLFTAGWEMYWRGCGYGPTLNDSKDLWAFNRKKVDSMEKGTVLIGASRMLFNFNLEVWQEAFGDMPVQLATVGTNASYYLEDLALNTKFAGTLLVGIVPPLFFVPEGQPVLTPKAALATYKEFGPAKRWNLSLAMFLERRLAFLKDDDIALKKLLEHLPVNNRPKAQIPPRIPPYFMEIDDNRQGMMSRRMESDAEFQQYVQNLWVPLFTPPPPPPIFTPEQFQKMFAEHMEHVLAKAKGHVEMIEKRGGKVIFIRFPSSDRVLELENQFAPRAATWDRIAALSGKGIHFEDHPSLQGFKLPEWSHLTRDDAHIFTTRLIELVRPMLVQ